MRKSAQNPMAAVRKLSQWVRMDILEDVCVVVLELEDAGASFQSCREIL